MKKLIAISLILVGCSTAKVESDNEKSSFDIMGRWEFISNESFGSNELPSKPQDSVWSLLSFFGAQLISESKGKTIEFTNSNTIKTNWLEQEKLDKAKFSYSFNPEDSVLTFTAVSPKNGSKIYIPTKVDFSDSIMVWNVDNLLAMQLNKLK